MFSRMIQWSAALIVVAVLPFGSAWAISLNPPAFYDDSASHNTGLTHFIDEFDFTFGNPTRADTTATFNILIDKTTTPETHRGFGLSLLDAQNDVAGLRVSWLDPTNALIDSRVFTGSSPTSWVIDFGSLTGAKLIFEAYTFASGGKYSFEISASNSRTGQEQLPLPPALVLFGSALVGLTVLGRRKRKGAAA